MSRRVVSTSHEATGAKRPMRTATLSAAESISAMRQRMRGIVPLGYPFESVLRTEDFKIPRVEGKIKVRLYVPQTVEALAIRATVLLYYHGGGFVAGISMATIRCFGL
jgi:acetyl esterase/lipase